EAMGTYPLIGFRWVLVSGGRVETSVMIRLLTVIGIQKNYICRTINIVLNKFF
ncbi:MAG: hypothetical protein RLZZ112_170, partial [Verrucomicrobiota bacterium]